MPGQPVKIGPWVGGLNNISVSGESADNQVVELINMEIALDTSLVSRPTIESVSGTSLVQSIGWEVLGIYRVTSTQWYVIVLKPTSATTWDVLAYQSADFTTTPTTIKSITGVANKIVAMVQYNDYVYFNVANGATDTGFRWKTGTAVAAIAAMPQGRAMTVFKDRIWISASGASATANRLWFSTVDGTGSHPETWNTSTDFIDVAPGNGGMNTALLALSGYILIFKEDATFRFSYGSKPAGGFVELVGQYIGAAGPTSVVAFDNYAIIYDQGRVYELINDKFTQLNLNVAFTVAANSPDATAPGVDMSVVNRRVLIRYFNTLYSYSVDTQTWSQWQVVAGTPGKFYELPTDSSQAIPSSYLASTEGTQQLVGNNSITDPSFADPDINPKRIAGALQLTSLTGGTASFTKTSAATAGAVHLNKTGKDTWYSTGTSSDILDYDIPVGAGQTWQFTCTATNSDSAVVNKLLLIFSFLLRDGTISQTTINLVAADLPNVSKTVVVPDKAILMKVQIGPSAASAVNSTCTISSVSCTRANVASPVGLLKLTESFQNKYQNTTPVEYIEAWVKTKAYDYQANSVFKRLFIWGADVKTPGWIEGTAYPLGKNAAPTWTQLESYTWAQLEQGTWGNPLSWVASAKTIVDKVPAQTAVSDNGRYFVKLGHNLRFRQIQFSLKMSTLGNSDTGPVKLFSLTTYTAARQLVVDKVTG